MHQTSLVASVALFLLSVLAACGSKQPDMTQPGSTSTNSGSGTDASDLNAPGAWRWSESNAQGFWCAMRPERSPMEMGPSFAIEVRLADSKEGQPLAAQPEDLFVEARMPDHGHGMLQRVEIEELSPGHFRVNGVRLHMFGYWELAVDWTRGPITERAQFAIEIESLPRSVSPGK